MGYRSSFRVSDDNGFVMVVALQILLILMIIGVAAVMTTNIELQIVGNEKNARQAFYVAESGWQRAFQVVENSGDKALDYINPLNFDDDRVAVVIDQPLTSGNLYSYQINRGSPTKAPGSGKDYLKFNYQVNSVATGINNAATEIEVIIEKVSR